MCALCLRHARAGWSERILALAAAVTAGWAACVAWWPTLPPSLTVPVDVARSLAWYALALHLYRRTVSDGRLLSNAFGTMAWVGLIMAALSFGRVWLNGQTDSYLAAGGIAALLSVAVCAILLVENLWFNTDRILRWHVALACVGLTGLFVYDILRAADTMLSGRVSLQLSAGQPLAALLVAPFFALHVLRNRSRAMPIRMSRTVASHSATLIISGVFLISLSVVGETLHQFRSPWGGVAEVGVLFAGMLAVAVLVTSGSARSWVRAVVVDNFFTHRYDYRTEWNRCIEILSTRDAYSPLHARVVRALAETVDSPAGALFLRDRGGQAFAWAGSWNMPAISQPVMAEHPVVRRFGQAERVVELSALSGEEALPGAAGESWLALPLGEDDLLGFVVLARPRATFRLDREVYGVLRTVARMSATFIAEQRVAQELAEANDLQAYAQRFAFVAHDIKNISSQLSLLLANAEVHLHNPEFQRDMLGTVRSSVQKVDVLLRRLQDPGETSGRSVLVPTERLASLVARTPRPAGIGLRLDDDDLPGSVAMSATAFDSVVTHLLGNAVEASQPGGEVTVQLRHDGNRLVIDIVDHGSGMSPEFVRDTLFRPFGTAKRGGTGIGAYQARELLRAAGGDLLAISEPGVGTTMRILLPLIAASAVTAAQRTG
ncbi:MAG: PEP-CTERM system histidine kinase PrsK [Acidisphaera sp.]|nr:PEP-CTERM system histidine kinase PrsK [Acidisphaera sp.]MBV9813468.1 PEP-CTERM system histidine kinase PrsK [Acetobacteraceae bacterium]